MHRKKAVQRFILADKKYFAQTTLTLVYYLFCEIKIFDNVLGVGRLKNAAKNCYTMFDENLTSYFDKYICLIIKNLQFVCLFSQILKNSDQLVSLSYFFMNDRTAFSLFLTVKAYESSMHLV